MSELLNEAIEVVGAGIDALAASFPLWDVGRDSEDDWGVPPEMAVGPVNDAGWVQWAVGPPATKGEDMAAVEQAAALRFPRFVKAWLLARSHLFHQLRAPLHDQLVMTPAVPCDQPLRPFLELIEAWRPLLGLGLLPVAEWGDGWGPVVVDVGHSSDDPDLAAVLWVDHEPLIELIHAGTLRRESVDPLLQQLYPNAETYTLDLLSWRPVAS